MTEDPHVVFSISITASLKKFVDQRTKWLRIGRSDYFKYWLESEREKGIDAPYTIERKPIKEKPRYRVRLVAGGTFKQQQAVHHEEPQKNGSNSNELLTYTEAAEHCHLRSSSKLRVAVRRRELQAVQLGPKTVRFQRSELDRWLNSKATRVFKFK